MREMRRKPEVPKEEVPVEECFDCLCKDYLKGTCTTPFSEKVASSRMLVLRRPRVVADLEKCSFAHCQVDEQPSKRSKK